jgi:hypothetical protein
MSKNGFDTAEGAGVVVDIAKGFMVPDPRTGLMSSIINGLAAIFN